MRVLVVENIADTSLGLVGEALAEAGAEIVWSRPWSGEPLPAGPDHHDAIVVLGGEQSALDDHTHPYLPDLARLMKHFGAVEKPVLGICLGSQLLARAHGGSNHLGVAPEFGWHAVSPTEAGSQDPVLSAVGGTFPIFEWHTDTFSLPEGAVRLATGHNVENQCFRIGGKSYGMQFHFEASIDVVEAWNRDYVDHIRRMNPNWHDEYEGHKQAHAEKSDAAGLAIARAWVGLIGQAIREA